MNEQLDSISNNAGALSADDIVERVEILKLSINSFQRYLEKHTEIMESSLVNVYKEVHRTIEVCGINIV